MRDSFVFYRSFYEALLGMSSDNQGDCLMAVANYAINGVEPEVLTPEVRMFFTLVKPKIDKNNQKCENGKNGGRRKNQTETEIKPNNNQTETETEASDNQNSQKEKEKTPPYPQENKNKNIYTPIIPEGIIPPKEKNFKKPTIEEIDTYCRESKHYVDVGRFYDFYESKGWKVGKSPMKDWRAAVRNWARSETPAPVSRKTADDDDAAYWAELERRVAENDYE